MDTHREIRRKPEAAPVKFPKHGIYFGHRAILLLQLLSPGAGNGKRSCYDRICNTRERVPDRQANRLDYFRTISNTRSGQNSTGRKLQRAEDRKREWLVEGKRAKSITDFGEKMEGMAGVRE